MFPAIPTAAGDVAGWTYLNLDNGQRAPYSRDNVAGAANRPSQNWVIVSMSAEGRYQVDFDAAWLGNGCSSAVTAGTQIAPAGGVLVCPQGTALCTPGVAPYTGTNTTPP